MRLERFPRLLWVGKLDFTIIVFGRKFFKAKFYKANKKSHMKNAIFLLLFVVSKDLIDCTYKLGKETLSIKMLSFWEHFEMKERVRFHIQYPFVWMKSDDGVDASSYFSTIWSEWKIRSIFYVLTLSVKDSAVNVKFGFVMCERPVVVLLFTVNMKCNLFFYTSGWWMVFIPFNFERFFTKKLHLCQCNLCQRQRNVQMISVTGPFAFTKGFSWLSCLTFWWFTSL